MTALSHGADQLTAALQAAGVRQGDVLFVQAGFAERHDPAAILAALRAAVGEAGTILVPTYTFSFCRGEVFDPRETPTPGGPWSPDAAFLEYFRTRPGVARSSDPIHSVAGEGPDAAAILDNVAATCFGSGSVFARLVERNALIVMLGLGLDEATLRHHSEEVAGVPFRFRKLFTGRIRDGERLRRQGWVYNVRILADNGFPDGERLTERAFATGIARRFPFADEDVTVVRARPFHELTRQLIAADPWATGRGPAGDPVALEEARVGGGGAAVALPARASMRDMIDALWRLPRDIVSDGYDRALAALATQVPMRVHEYPSGTECWSWIVPEKWTCHEARLEQLDGTVLLSYGANPLHVVSYSLPFEGEVTRAELLEHLHVHPRLPDAIPFVFKYYERDWGLCCSRTLRDSLQDERYRVVIRTTSSYGTLKVGEVVVPGESGETFVLCAHLCHPGMVNDDLTGVVVGVDVMRALLAGPRPKHTWRFLIVPETIGSIAWLSHNERLIAGMKGGLFLEMLGRDIPHALQRSFNGSTSVDELLAETLATHDSRGWVAAFRELAGNDERQFNAPGVRVPMLALSRQLPASDPDFPYREYHSSADTPDRVPEGRLEESRDLVLRMVEALDRESWPSLRHPGEVFCSRYGINVDFAADPAAHKALFDVLFLLDGTRTEAAIAAECEVALSTVRGIVAQLRAHGLLRHE